MLVELGYSPADGARALKRVIDREIVHRLADLLGSDQLHSGDFLWVDFDGRKKEFTFSVRAKGMSPTEVVEMAERVIYPGAQMSDIPAPPRPGGPVWAPLAKPPGGAPKK